MNRFSEVMTVESSPLTLRLPKELLHVPVKVTVEQAPPRRRASTIRGRTAANRKQSSLVKSIEEHSWVMGERLYRSRDDLYERK